MSGDAGQRHSPSVFAQGGSRLPKKYDTTRSTIIHEPDNVIRYHDSLATSCAMKPNSKLAKIEEADQELTVARRSWLSSALAHVQLVDMQMQNRRVFPFAEKILGHPAGSCTLC